MRAYAQPLVTIFFFFFFSFGIISPSIAGGNIEEIKGVTIEEKGTAGRDEAVAEATKQAAQRVLDKMAQGATLPKQISAAKLEGLTTYVDIEKETIQPNYYAGTFNIGVRIDKVMELVGLAENRDSISGSSFSSGMSADQTSYASSPTYQTENITKPSWVLIIPALERNGEYTLWDNNNVWNTSWLTQRQARGVIFSAAGGDFKDRNLLKAESLNHEDVALKDTLDSFAFKYGAPAVAVVTLHSSDLPPSAQGVYQLSVTYTHRDDPDLQNLSKTVQLPQSADTAAFYSNAIEVAKKMILKAAQGEREAPSAPATTSSLNEQSLGSLSPPVQSATVYAAQSPGNGVDTEQNMAQSASGTLYPQANENSRMAASSSTMKRLWVRIPLNRPADLMNIRRTIAGIQGAQFDISAMSKSYVEGYIIYAGDQSVLLQQLQQRGLAPQKTSQ